MSRRLLVEILEEARILFAGVGTNAAKRRLRKLSASSPLAGAALLALLAEDYSTQGKKYAGKWSRRCYERKHAILMDLAALCWQHAWPFGVHADPGGGTTHVIYFDLPGCDQISFHVTLSADHGLPAYAGQWDGRRASTMAKLDRFARDLLNGRARDYAMSTPLLDPLEANA